MLSYNKTKFNTIIPFSGGIDSTAALYSTLIKNPDKKYLVFHIDIINATSGNRYILEKKAVQNILTYLLENSISNFCFKSLSIDYSNFDIPLVWDSEVVNFMAAMIVQDKPEIEEFIEGAIWDDYQEEGFKERLMKIASIFYTCSGRTENDFKFSFPLKNLKKHEVMRLIPHELLKVTWSCRYPEIGLPYTLVRCHKCPPCKIIDNAFKQHPNEFPML